ncbi:heat shock protein (plasmid) [Mesomycoplasma conjunctivae]|nr:nucleotide exchange factor GrpE [Mycoplasmopsis fermentans]VEU60373.1 heat shock protein [Mycoplasmopsis fermentans]VEU67515.1 heat shock protein [Mesomycoplasma conjunctivae]
MKVVPNLNKFKTGEGIIANISVYNSSNAYQKQLSKEKVSFVLGENTFLPNFDNNIVEQTVRPVLDFVVTFPKSYEVAEFKDKTFRFVIEILDYQDSEYVKAYKQMLALREEIQKLNVASGNHLKELEELKAKNEKQMSEISNLKTENDKHTKDSADLKNQYQEQEKTIQKLIEDNKKFIADNNALKEDNENKGKQIKELMSGKTTKLMEQTSEHEAKGVNPAVLRKQVDVLRKQLEEQSIELKELRKNKAPEAVQRVTVPKEEVDKIKQYALQKFFEDFSTHYTTLKGAVKAGAKSENSSVKNYVVGFEMILNLINGVLEKHCIKAIEPKIGDEFDPNTQKVLEVEECKDKKHNTIVKVSAIGFKLHDRVIKPALVVIAQDSSAKDKKLAAETKKPEAPKAKETTKKTETKKTTTKK